MKHPIRNTILLAGIAILVSSAALALGPAERSYGVAVSFMSLDGAAAGFVKKVAGGGISAEVVVEPVKTGSPAKKHIGQPKYEEVSVDVGFMMTRNFYEWLSSSWKSSPTRKDVEITTLDPSMAPVSAQKYSQALITGTTIPTCDGASKEPAYLTVTLAPETTRAVRPSKASSELGRNEQKVWLSSDFALSIDGLDCSKVSRIESFTVKQKIVSEDVGEMRDTLKEPIRTEFPDLRITISEASAKAWIAWHDSFVVKGNNDDTKEKKGSLVFYDQTMAKELARVSFSNMGIRALTRNPPKDAGGIATVTIDLYCESMELVVTPAPL
jgi:hypothetical protein